MTQSYTHEVGFLENGTRFLAGLVCKAVFNLLDIIYQIFFNVATSDIFDNEGIVAFFSRIQLILGVFMVFQLAMIIIKGIIEPDSIMGNPKKGQPSVIFKIVTALALLVLVVPLNIADTSNLNEFEEKVNKNGLLFGTLYSLQYRVIKTNTFGKLILGATDDDTSNYLTGGSTVLEEAAHSFSMGVIKSFIKVNLKDKSQLTEVENGDYASLDSNRLCPNIGNLVDIYNDPNSSINDIIDLAEETCTTNLTTKYYAFTFDVILAVPIGILFVFLFLSFSVDIAIRSIKFAILRLIAPIPIISYMDPKGSKDSAFNAWVSLVTTTYLDLFFRVGIVYFVLFIINNMMGDTFTMIQKSGAIGVISQIVIWIGLLAFAKEAPKFFYQAFGIKGDPSGTMFGGLTKAMAIGAAATSPLKTGMAHAIQGLREVDENEADDGGYSPFGKLLRQAGAVAGGLTFGGASGAFSAANGVLTGKELNRQTVNKAINDNIANRRAGNTLLRRVGASVGNTFGINAAYQHNRQDLDMKAIADRSKHISDWIDANDNLTHQRLEELQNLRDSGTATDQQIAQASDRVSQAREQAMARILDPNDHHIAGRNGDIDATDVYGEIQDLNNIAERNNLVNAYGNEVRVTDYRGLSGVKSAGAERQYRYSASNRRRRADAPYVAGGTAPNNGGKK